MKENEHLLVCTIEECNEVQEILVLMQQAIIKTEHALSKTLRFGPDETWPKLFETNAQRVTAELTDLYALVEWLVEKKIITHPRQPDIMHKKRCKVAHYMQYARNCGTLE